MIQVSNSYRLRELLGISKIVFDNAKIKSTAKIPFTIATDVFCLMGEINPIDPKSFHAKVIIGKMININDIILFFICTKTLPERKPNARADKG